MSCEENCNGNCEHNHEHNVGIDEIARHNNFLISVLIKTLITKGIISDEDMNKTVMEFQEAVQADAQSTSEEKDKE